MFIHVQGESIGEAEQKAYLTRALEKYGKELKGLEIQVDGDEAVLSYYLISPRSFERVRRITGYLVGALDRWNDAKRAEERDRVKHTTASVKE